ncbi:DNA cytosine methyltransferase [Rivihabitans pingtungensis]|uniref:DNA cytosine methyltransferase n=1 Tax=Rivihabitans pingtungensis TaxID=1054498 RepID=UPI002354C704|nr:DNA cytosine methyltransferase [Rivihabitans pingtungensis]MCK6437386.1 DNA cytosine methyltransferase [Rivihabitans pingtungensis]
MSLPEFLSVKDVAERLNISQQRVRFLLRSCLLEGRQVGKQWLISPASLESYTSSYRGELKDHPARRTESLPELKALSFFSGAMGLDLGLEKAGIPILLACEVDKHCRKTIEMNRPDLALLGNIEQYTAQDIRKAAGLSETDEIDVIVGGPPCQAFSTAGARRGFQDVRGNVFLKFIDLLLELKPKYAVIENVRGLLSAPLAHRPHAERGEEWAPGFEEKPGGALLHIIQTLRAAGYGVSFNLYNAANFGVPQVRERVILICSRNGEKLPHLNPTHSQDGSFGLPKWRTFREAIKGVEALGCDHVNFPEDRLRYYQLLGPGQYWKHLPEELQKEALGKSYYSGGGKTGFFRRMSWDKPSCTLVTAPNMPATDICHPVEQRPLSIQEYKRLQMFPDDWQLGGKLVDQYRQVGNAVPSGLGEAVGRAILAHMANQSVQPPAGFPFSRYKNTDEVSWEEATRKTLGLDSEEPKPAKKPIMAASKTEKAAKVNTPPSQMHLFEEDSSVCLNSQAKA